MPPPEEHFAPRTSGWLRAAVLGANDGIVSIASLLVGVASGAESPESVFLAGIAGWVAGAMSMAAGEYVSVSSQADSEEADRARERRALALHPDAEREELAAIYVGRGLERSLALQVAEQLMAHDALSTHLREELGLSDTNGARPMLAALTSGGAFTAGAAVPLVTVWLHPQRTPIILLFGVAVCALAVLGALAARVGGSSARVGAARVVLWGALAMGLTAAVGRVVGTAV